MKFDIKWFLRKLCFNMLMGPQYERPWLKGQRLTLTLEKYLYISNEKNDFGFHSIQNTNFSKNSNSNALGIKFDLHVKQVKVNLGPSFEQTW